MNRQVFYFLLIVGIIFSSGISVTTASAQLGTFEAPVWVPIDNSPNSDKKSLELQITIMVNGQPVTKNVKIDSFLNFINWLR